MLKVTRVTASLGRALRCSTGSSISLPGSRTVSGRVLGRHAHDRIPRGLEQSCTVDPNQEERFWFVEVTDPEEEPVMTDVGPKQSSPPPPLTLRPPPQRTPSRSVQLHLKNLTSPDLEDESLIHFHDADLPLCLSVVASIKKKKAALKEEHKIYGTPDSEEPISDTRCPGCGAVLHCADTAVPGYLPSEKYKVLLREERLNSATCQRCHFLRHHQKALNMQVSKDEFRNMLREIRSQRALVLLIVDLLDVPDSVVPELPDLVGPNKHVVVLGNKIDLLPADSPNYLQRIRRQLGQFCQEAGFGTQVSDVHLISAKTGYGIEGLISSLQRSWKYKGDVYLVGSANAGKSTLFNALLQSDYCKSRASDIVGKATISPWPGTTLNLLKFPIINPTPYRMFRRHQRLRESRRQTEDDLSPDELKCLKDLRRQGYLVGRVGRTFLPQVVHGTIAFDPDALAFGEDNDGENCYNDSTGKREDSPGKLTYNELKDAHWLFDTPGIMKEQDVLGLLTQQEVKAVVPTRAVVPRTYLLKAGMSLFVGGLARIDFLEGEKSCWFSVIASSQVPVHVSSVEKADAVYQKHGGRELLGVPVGGTERMKNFPALTPQDFQLEGRGPLEAAADVKLSSAGWVAVTALEGQRPLLRVHGPPSAGFGLRMPPLLPHVVTLKGARIPKSCAYKVLTPAVLLDAGLRRKRKTTRKDKRKAADK
ncbi:LOW QUALITY PROTEIN: nitric oxide-associated protein 1 [Phycodurus eques]|uniref:LOW QUALITY PROTEIN: nitric oxide-associated protein 1 n=1 Tax=Phycodurus eques TaxID=693459 RepID=UPI002ACE022A|nr:LOW QUALITY PROTEIN: nitric oxide-associated protein 1 [Phycodurus eques]